MFGPEPARVPVSEVVTHPTRPGREDREIGAALALQLQLSAFQALANRIIGYRHDALLADVRRVHGQGSLLRIAVVAEW